LIVIVLMMLITTYYDSSFVPVMNAGAIAAVGDLASFSQAGNIYDAVIHVSFISGVFELDLTFTNFMITEDRDDPFPELLDLLDFLPHQLPRHGHHDLAPARYLPPGPGIEFQLLR
jgi:hypothetical protein